MSSPNSDVAVWFFQEHPRQTFHFRRAETWTIAVLRDNQSVGNPAPRAFSSSEYMWRAAAWVGFHLRSRGNRRWKVVCVPGRLTPESLEKPAMRRQWFPDRDETCWRALQLSRELTSGAGLRLTDPRDAPVTLRIPINSWGQGVVLGIGLVVAAQALIVALAPGLSVQDWMPLADILVGAGFGAWLTVAVRRKWLARQRRRAASQLADRWAAFPEWAVDAGELS